MSSENSPIVSVIIPTYNRAKLVGRAVNSVLSQTFEDFELLVIDDASTDDTQRVLQKFEDKRVSVIQHKENKGGAASRNTGIKLSRGKYVGLLDDDDEWIPDKLESQMRQFQKSSKDVGMIYTGFYFVSDKNLRILRKVIPDASGKLYPDILRRSIPGCNTYLIRKSCLNKVGLFDEGLPSCQDWDMWIRVCRRYEVRCVREALSKVFIHGEQISTDLNSRIVGREKLIAKYDSDLKRNPAILAFLLKRLGILNCLNRNPRRGLKYFIGSLKLAPIQRDCYNHILLILLRPRYHRQSLERAHATKLGEVFVYY